MLKIRKTISVLLTAVLLISCLQLTAADAEAASYTGKYWLKVNEQQNVVTVYRKEDGKWTPIRAMLCSTGLNGTTPRGTFYTKGKWNWGELINDVYGQYCTHITGDILFHSVYYTERYDKSSQVTAQFNMLGQAASHGCVRLSVADAKWIYVNCKVGTRVTIYRSSSPGPLGKPSPTRVSTSRYQYWDPTDPDPDNPYYILRKPVITVSSKKKLNVQYGSTYYIKDYVNAKDPNTFQNLKDKIKVSKIQRYSVSKGKYINADFSTRTLGTYKVTYSAKAPLGKTAYKTIKIKVVDNLKAPVISGAKNRTVTWGDTNAVSGVTARQASASRTTAMKVLIKAPGSSTYKTNSYSAAKTYRFAKTGKYSVRYVVKNKYSPYKEASRTVTITSKKGAVNEDPVLVVPDSKGDRTVTLGTQEASDLFSGVTASHNGKDATSRIQITLKRPDSAETIPLTQAEAASYIMDIEGTYTVTYSVKNRYTPYQTVKKTVKIQVVPSQNEII